MLGCNVLLKYTSAILTYISFQQTLDISAEWKIKPRHLYYREILPGEKESDYLGNLKEKLQMHTAGSQIEKTWTC